MLTIVNNTLFLCIQLTKIIHTMQGITIFEPKRQGAMPDFLDHTDMATRRSVNRFNELIENYEEDLDAAVLYRSMTSNDMARVLAFMVDTKFYNNNNIINIENFELV